MRKLFFILLTIIGLTSMPINSYASEKEITIYFFRGYNCIHCEGSLEYLNNHKDEIPTNIKIVTYEVWKNKNNEKLHQELVKKLEVPEDNSDSVPFLVIGNEYIVGMDGTKEDFDKVMSLAESFEEKDYEDVVAATTKEMTKENKDIKFKSITLEKLFGGTSKTVTYIVLGIFAAIVLGFVGMILFSRKN